MTTEKMTAEDVMGLTAKDWIRIRARLTLNTKQAGPNECWLWLGGLDSHGYGRTQARHKEQKAARLAYAAVHGPIARGLFIDHICRNVACVNVAHLRTVTPCVNTLENSLSVSAIAASRIECPRGHPYSGENLIRDRGGSRLCRICTREKNRRGWAAWRARNPGQRSRRRA